MKTIDMTVSRQGGGGKTSSPSAFEAVLDKFREYLNIFQTFDLNRLKLKTVFSTSDICHTERMRSISFYKDFNVGKVCPTDRTKKAAFTLAEVLITLGIIGVVAAMTLPAVINNTQNKELKTQFQKTYTELNQIARMFYNDYGISVSEYTTSRWSDFVYDIFPKYLKNGKKLDDWNWTKVDETGSSINTMYYKIYGIDGKSVQQSICDNGGVTSAANGVMYYFNDPPSSGKNGPNICVDINGKKKPNRYGKDFFIFVFTTDGFVIPMGQEHKNNSNSSPNWYYSGPDRCKYHSWGFMTGSCAYYALQDKHPTDENKTYWKDFINGK